MSEIKGNSWVKCVEGFGIGDSELQKGKCYYVIRTYINNDKEYVHLDISNGYAYGIP